MALTIIHLVSSRRDTGAASVALSWHKALLKEGISSLFIYEGGHNLAEKLQNDPTAYPIRQGLARGKLQTLTHSPFIILAHLPPDHFWAWCHTRKSALPVVHRERYWQSFFLIRWLYKGFPGKMMAYGKEPFRDFIPPAFLAPEKPIPPGDDRPFHLGTIGKLTSDREHRWVLDIYLALQPLCPEARLLIIGEGPEKATLQKIVTHRHLEDKVIFTGYVEGEALIKALQKIKILIWPAPGSHHAHRALPEAALCGCCMASPPMPYQEAWIKDGRTGLTLPYLPSQAAQKLHKLLRQPEKLNQIARTGQTWAWQNTRPQRVAQALKTTLLETSEI